MKKLSEREVHGGVQILYRAANGYGASVIRHQYSFGVEEGLWELAVVRFDDDSDNFNLCYDTSITNDVIGRLTWSEVEGILAQIQELPEATQGA